MTASGTAQQTQVTAKFDFDVIAAGFIRLITDQKMVDRFWKHIDPDMFFYGDKTLKIRGFREILKEFKKICSTEGSTIVTTVYLGSRLRMSIDTEELQEARSLYDALLASDEIRKLSVDDGTFSIFLDYLKVTYLMKWSKPFMSDYRGGKIKEAIDSMRDIIPTLDGIKVAEDYKFNVDDLDTMLPQDDSIVADSLFLGAPILDLEIGGFEPQTLSIFLSVTGGGKSMMNQHLIRRALMQKKSVHITCVEDRPKSFSRRLIASLTGIKINRLKNEFHLLTDEEKTQILVAKELIRQYIEVDFVYGESIHSVHKRKLDYDAYRARLGLQPYLVDIVDYTGHIAKFSMGDKMYEKLHNAFSARKDFVLKHNKIGLDAAQINREGLKGLENDSRYLSHADLAGGFDLSQVCDFIISINRSERQKDENKATLFVCKGRDSMAGLKVHVGTDFARAQWRMEEGSADMMNATRRNEVMSQAINEVVSGEDTL